MRTSALVVYRSLYDTYENLSSILWVTLLWLLMIIPIVTFVPVTIGLFDVIKQIRAGKSVAPNDLWRSIKDHFGIGMRITFIYLLICGPGYFYLVSLYLHKTLFSYIMMVFLLYLLFIVNLIVLFMIPLMVNQQETRVMILFQRSLRLVIENFVFVSNIALYLLLITFICSILTILIVVWAGWLAMTVYNALIYLLSKYDSKNNDFDLDFRWKNA